MGVRTVVLELMTESVSSGCCMIRLLHFLHSMDMLNG